MARLARLVVPGELHLVMWRGHRHSPVFVDDADRRQFLALVWALAPQHGVQLHAYVLLDREILLLLTPEGEATLSGFMQALGRSYGRCYNQRHGGAGTLWEGRYRSTVLEADRLWLAMLTLDLAPVRAGLVHAPEGYAWTSHAHYRGWRVDSGLTPHALWWSLGNTPFAREAAYAQLVQQGASERDVHQLLRAVQGGWPLGAPGFLARLEGLSGRRVVKARAGRPRKIIDSADRQSVPN